MKYEVLYIGLDEYIESIPDEEIKKKYMEDSNNFPDLKEDEHVTFDGYEVFIYCKEQDEYWYANEFFEIIKIDEFTTLE